MAKRKRSVQFAVAACMVVATAAPTAVWASGFYLGADEVFLTTRLDHDGGTDTYKTYNFRARAGYEFADSFAVEIQGLTADNDTERVSSGDEFVFDTGEMFGVYLKSKTTFETYNVYGLLGASLWKSSYANVATGPTDAEWIAMFGAGVGGEFDATENLRIHIEGMFHAGSAEYNSYFTDSVVVYSVGVAAGFTYRF